MRPTMYRRSYWQYRIMLLLAFFFPLPLNSATLPILFLLEQATTQTGGVGSPDQESKPKVTVKVVDENGVPVSSARVSLIRSETQAISNCQTDYTGRCEMDGLGPGVYQVEAEQEGFYSTILRDLQVNEAQELEVTLNHLQEYADSMDVVDSPVAIDPQQTTKSQDLGYREIINIPYPTTRDVRGALPFIPGVLADVTGQIHVGGSDTYQIVDQLDGFNITQPVTGLLDLRVSADALRSMDVQSSRYPAEYGRGSGGVMNMVTGTGDDRYRFNATNFIPSIQTRKGLNINEWTPRATFSGPLKKGKAWFFDAADYEYDLNIIEELPAGADENPVWRFSNLSKVQVNLNPTNILTGSFLINEFHAAHLGLSALSPLETTLDQRQNAYLFTVKDQAYLARGLLLETGFGFNQYGSNEQPLGSLPYTIRPEGTSGNYYRTADGGSHRLQGFANLTLPPLRWHGRHVFKAGTDLSHITYNQLYTRQPVLVLREDGTLSRKVDFINSSRFEDNNLQWSGFAQDRW
ncbi:MAG TPA: carboxypeptidase regulatory-like domain-containing protein, partial [Terriglobia bacterium]|nr:carboxypeptidase regulatory-like domain-containing protein [Terriglobia bacterium]